MTRYEESDTLFILSLHSYNIIFLIENNYLLTIIIEIFQLIYQWKFWINIEFNLTLT